MLVRTHLAITVLGILLLINHVEHQMVFIGVALIATLMPDMDSGVSTVGKKPPVRIIQFFLNHRGALHSFTFLVIVSIALALFLPIAALPFFLGYGLHLFADSFTIMGIKPFYPSHATSSGKIRTGGRVEKALFAILLLTDLIIAFFKVYSLQ